MRSFHSQIKCRPLDCPQSPSTQLLRHCKDGQASSSQPVPMIVPHDLPASTQQLQPVHVGQLNLLHPATACSSRTASPLPTATHASPAVTRGNKTERASPLVFSFILALPLLGMYIYFVAYQTYV